MKFSADHYFQIGHAHYTAGKPCQDYALSQSSGFVSYAIVSDGCSTGGNTDMGSRILTFGTSQAIRDHMIASNGSLTTAQKSIAVRQQQLISAIRHMLGLERGDLLATCAYAYITKNGGLIHLQGDGVIAWKYRDGTIYMRRYDWAANTPFYPSYEDRDLAAFVECHGNDLTAKRLSEQVVVRTEGGTYTEPEVTSLTLQQGILGISVEVSPDELQEIEFLAVFTDGVAQIENVDWRDAATEFLAFKTTTGEFAKRRMIRGVRDMQRIGKGPIDDIAYAVIHKENA